MGLSTTHWILIVLMLCALALYFLPSIVARLREHQNAMAISATNLLLGWTVLGWIVALIWAFTEVRKPAKP